VLCAIDLDKPSFGALAMGRALAEGAAAVLETLTVAETDAWPYAAHFPTEYSGVLADRWHDEAVHESGKNVRALRQLETEVNGVLTSKAQHADYGPPAQSLVRHGERYDVVIVGAPRETRPNLTTFGSVVEAVLERSATDVLVARG
jgi:nucleotide-binding universal stress UspA family protein